MSPVVWTMAAVWGTVTALLVIVVIYRSTLTMHEDEQLFLGDAGSHMQEEQKELMCKVDKLTPFVRWLGAASGALILVIAVTAIYQGLNS